LCYFFGNLHPEYAPTLSNTLFITGESYAGKYIPATTLRILQGGNYRIEGSSQSCVPLHLEGIAIGNGLVDPYYQRTVYPEQAYANAFLNSYQRSQGTNSTILNFQKILRTLTKKYFLAEFISSECQRELLLGNTIVNAQTKDHPCFKINDFIHAAAGNFTNYDIRLWQSPIDESLLESYLNLPQSKEAFHVNENTEFHSCSDSVYNAIINDILVPQRDSVAQILEGDTRVLFYNGQFDMQDGPIGTAQVSLSLHFSPLSNRNLRRVFFLVVS
jgi:carboxypeptidase C (cathepsin A)